MLDVTQYGLSDEYDNLFQFNTSVNISTEWIFVVLNLKSEETVNKKHTQNLFLENVFLSHMYGINFFFN